MLKVQKYLKTHTLEQLTSKYGIKVLEHEDGRVVLNYDMIESPKTAEIVRECRGLCLAKPDYRLISRSFRRFFNAGEWRADDNKFNWNDCFATSKEDGTLINFYWYNNKWQVQTRGSFGDIPFYVGGPTPEELVYKILGNKINGFDKSLSYALELCTVHNKIVREYKEPTLYLLSVFEGEEERPFSGLYKKVYCALNHSVYCGIDTPEMFKFSSMEEVELFIRAESKNDKTFEGVVLRDNNNVRLKVKSPEYLALHRMRGNGDNIYLAKNLFPFIFKGETEELLCYFGEAKERVDELTSIYQEQVRYHEFVWNRIKGIKSRKEFALSMPIDLKLKCLLFNAYTKGVELKEVWKESYDVILKALF